MKLLKQSATSKPTSKNKNSPNDYEQLGRMIANVYEMGYMDRKKMYKMSLIKGVITGFGGVIGATLVVALVVWILSLLNYVPIIEKVTDPLTETIRNAQER